ncbi:MAG: hypothetical protein JXA04_05610 [Gammaproteobacteria bacterium]|nr:hypothetical protein [Gammaproteobacteria bacterium]
MRLFLYLTVVSLYFADSGYAQDQRDFGQIAPPVLESPVKPDLPLTQEISPIQKPSRTTNPNSTPATTESTRKELTLPGVDFMPAPAMDLSPTFNSAKQQSGYRAMEIIVPANNTTVDIRTTNLLIKTNVVPPVRNELGHVLQIKLDDEVLVENQTSYVLADATPGVHSIMLVIIDENKNVIAQSPGVTVQIK